MERRLTRIPLVSALALCGTLVALTACSSYTTTTATQGKTSPISGVVADTNNDRVAIIGDSIEAGLGLSKDQAWPELVAADEQWNLDNLGVSGAGYVAHGTGEKTFADEVRDAIADKAQVVFIGASDNDLGKNLADVTQQMQADVALLHSSLPDAEIIGYNAISGSASDSELAPLNAALEKIVEAHGGYWLDVGEPYRGVSGLVQKDGEHPTAAGQQAIAALVEDALTTNEK